MERNYYIDNEVTIMKRLRPQLASFRRVLGEDSGETEADRIYGETLVRFRELLTRLSYIGGDRNILTENLIVSALFLSLYKVLSRQGRSDQSIGDLCYRIAEDFVNRKPRWTGWITGKVTAFVAGPGRWILERLFGRLEKVSGEKNYPGDFAFRYVKGDGRHFDFGVDFTECGICKLFAAEGASAFTPHMCRIDYLTTSFNGIELIRQGTIAGGADRCDFRFRVKR